MSIFSILLHLKPIILVLILRFAGVHSESTIPTKIGNGYRLISLQESGDGGIVGHLTVNEITDIYGPDIPLLRLYVKHETDDRLRVHITDAKNIRWEVPYDILPRDEALPRNDTIDLSRNRKLRGSHYKIGSKLVFNYVADPFSFTVRRKSNGQTLFNSTSDSSDPYSSLVFKDQYLEISTKLPKEASLFGLGENTQPHGIKLHPNDPYTLYTTDISAGHLNTDLYGSHPVYMDLRNVGGRGFAHAVLLLNSNGMDVMYRGDSVTYKVIGGVFDFYFFAGPTPLEVVDQYTALVGRPAPMPYWAFGFHQCKFGYQNLSVLEDVVENYKKAKIPLDVIWNDDDHMDGAKDFTLDPINYPQPKLLDFLDKLHSKGMKYIVIIDPGISVNSSYGVYQRGMANDVFIKYEGKPFVGQVWPGAVYYPDYLNPKAIDWWSNEIQQFHKLVPVDGLWIDMNEVSNFCTGLCTVPRDKPCPNKPGSDSVCCLDCTDITNTRWDNPPYKINASGNGNNLGYRTIATSAVHYDGVLEYDAHSLYGLSEAIATYKALLGIDGERPFILSRSTFVGSGHYSAHWTGDNSGTWDELKYSISTMLNFGIFGIPMVGSDICGFYSTGPKEELCNRWIELGAFYPFSRDHADTSSTGQELYQWESVAESARNALGMRYKLLPYLYTLNYEAHTSGAPIARPLFFSFPDLPEFHNLSTQFLLGSSLMISPVLEQGKTEVKILFPPGSWYNLFNMKQVIVSRKVNYVTLDAPLNVINVHLYQNSILPMQQGGMLTRDARDTPFSLVITFPAGSIDGEAMGKLFIDNDELPEMKLGNGYSTYVEFYATVKNGKVLVWSNVNEGEFAMNKGWTIEKVSVLGLEGIPLEYSVDVNGYHGQDIPNVDINPIEQSCLQVESEGDIKKTTMVEIVGLKLHIGNDFIISWKMGLLSA